MIAALEQLSPRSLAHLSRHLTGLVRTRLWLQVLVGLALGIATGVLIGPSVGWLHPATGAVVGDWLAFPGKLFLASIQMIVMPLVFASIIRGLAASDNVEQLRSAGVRVTSYFVATTAAAATLGIALAVLVEPGAFVSPDVMAGLSVERVAVDAPAPPGVEQLPQVLIDLLPGNPLGSMVEGEMLQVVIFAVVVGVALVAMPADTARPLLDLLGSLQEVCMTVVRWAMLLAPVAVFGLMAQLASRIGVGALLGLAVYVATVLAGLVTLLVAYLVIVRVFGGVGPGRFLSATREVLLLAFSTSSSAAVMPLSIRVAEQSLEVRPSIAQFVIALGATINMNGTALYQAIAAVFLAQLFGIDVSVAGLALIVAMTVGASIGSPATPGVGIVILAMVVGSIGVPPAGVALIMGVDRVLDMARTSVNVAGDLVACRLMDRWVKGSRDPQAERAEQSELDARRALTGADTLVVERRG